MNRESSSTRGLSIWDHLAIMLRWRRVMIVVLFLVAAGSVVYALTADKWYRSSARVLPPPPTMFGLANMLPDIGQAAIGLMGGFSNEMNLVLTILDSRRMRDEVISTFDWHEKYELTNSIEAYERYDDVVAWEVRDDGSIHVIVEELDPDAAAETVNFIVSTLRSEYVRITADQALNQRTFIGKRVQQVEEDLASVEEQMRAFQERTGVISLEDQLTASVEAIAQLHAELIQAEVQLDVYRETLPKGASELLLARQRVSTLRNKLDELNSQSADQNRSFLIGQDVAPSVGLEYLRLYRQIEISQTILEFLYPQMEQAKIMENRESSNLYVIDWGQVPEERSRPRRSFIVLAAVFLGFVVTYLIVFTIDRTEALQEEDPERYDTIQDTLAMLKPRNFFGRGSPSPSRDHED